MDQKTKFWGAHVGALKREAIAASGYARRHDLAVKSLYYWRSKLEGTNEASQISRQPAPLGQASKFVALQVAAPRPLNCTLNFPCGLRLEMATLPPAEWVVALLHSASGVR